jgi:hypothetical protein
MQTNGKINDLYIIIIAFCDSNMLCNYQLLKKDSVPWTCPQQVIQHCKIDEWTISNVEKIQITTFGNIWKYKPFVCDNK